MADFDELFELSVLLGELLPTRFLAIIQNGYPFEGYKQLSMAQRLKRTLDLQASYGNIGRPEIADDLTPTFQLAQAEKVRVLELSSQMRGIVFKSAQFDEPHKRRLLNRIAAIENEINQPKGKLDVILAGLSDIGDAANKFGNAAPSFVRFEYRAFDVEQMGPAASARPVTCRILRTLRPSRRLKSATLTSKHRHYAKQFSMKANRGSGRRIYGLQVLIFECTMLLRH